MDITIRLEQTEDRRKVDTLIREAFWNLYKPGCDEHYLAHVLRGSHDFIECLNFVVEYEHDIVGSIMYTKSYVVNEAHQRIDTVTFGPLCVHPQLQRQGIGTRLIEHTKKVVVELGYPAIIIFGDPHNYCKYGFKNGKDYNIWASFICI